MSTPLKFFIFSLLLATPFAHAGYMEIGATANYRKSAIDGSNYQEILSYTASYSYYFWEMSALELSYTSGENVVSVQINNEPKSKITTRFSLIGLDLVVTMADKESAFQPYFKIGAAYIQKDVLQEVENLSAQKLNSPSGVVPSVGLGFKIKMTKEIALKCGVDAWSSPLDKQPFTVDYAGRAGISWLF